MTNISDPNATEMRGWVMLMLERAAENVNPSECNDPAVLLACSLGSDSCPAACQKDDEEPTTDENGNPVAIKSGDLSVSAERNEGASVISSGATSELDTLTFNASEEITLNSITLERYGYSTASSVASIWLEDLDGNKVTAEKSLSTSKDTVTLSLKKDYKTINDGDKLIVVITTPSVKSAADLGKSIGFKVTEVDASAKNLNLSNYSANLYDIIDYAGTDAKIQLKGSSKLYNYESDKSYEVAKVKVTATNAAVLVRGFTLTQKSGSGTMNLDEFVDTVEVSVDGKVIDSKTSIKRDELTVSFADYEIAINKNSQFAVNVILKDFDEFGAAIDLGFEDSSDITILESKNKVRVSNDIPNAGLYNGPLYVFNGGKINLTNVKLSSTIDAAIGADDVVIAEGKIALGGQAIRLKNLKLAPSVRTGYVESIKFIVNDEEYEATAKTTPAWTVKDVVIDENATIKVTVDISDNENGSGDFKVLVNGTSTSALSKSTLSVADYAVKYDDVSSSIAVTAKDNIVGSISISSVKIQSPKGSLTNDSTKKVEFKVGETTSDVPVFKGTYTAKNNGNVNLDNVKVWRSSGVTNPSDDVVFTIKIGGTNVATIDNPSLTTGDDSDFSPIAVKAGESVSVEVLATVYASTGTSSNLQYKIQLSGKDDSNNDAGIASKDLAPMSFVDNSSISVTTNAAMKLQDVVLANKNQNLATFIVKPSNGATTANLDKLAFTLDSHLTGLINDLKGPASSVDADDYFELKIGNNIVDDGVINLDSGTLIFDDINTDITSATQVTVTFKEKLDVVTGAVKSTTVDNSSSHAYTFTLASVNDKPGTSYSFTRVAVHSLVRVSSMVGNNDSETKYRFEIEYSDDVENESISSVSFVYEKALPAGADSGTTGCRTWTNVQADKNYTVDNGDTANYVTDIVWVDGDNYNVKLNYSKNNDFFKTNGSNEDRLRAYAND